MSSPVTVTEPRPTIDWPGSVGQLFQLLTGPGHTIREEEGPEYLVRAVHLRVSLRRSSQYFPRLELHVDKKPAPLTADAVRRWQRDNERLLQDARTIFGIGWVMIEESDAGDGIHRTYIELLAGEKEPGKVPCRCGQQEYCPGIPARCLAEIRTANQQTMRSLREPKREIQPPYGGMT